MSSNKRYAILCCVEYIGTDQYLDSIQNISDMSNFLVQKCRYDPKYIYKICDSNFSRGNVDKTSIKNTLNSIVNECHAGDSLFFYYCGHGSIQTSTGILDNVIIPSDYKRYTCVEKDWVTNLLTGRLNNGVTLWSLFDCCHSDTMIELQYQLRPDCIYTPPPPPTIPSELQNEANTNDSCINTPQKTIEDILLEWEHESKPPEVEPTQVEPPDVDQMLDALVDNLVTKTLEETLKETLEETHEFLHKTTTHPSKTETENVIIPKNYCPEDWRGYCNINVRKPSFERMKSNNIFVISGSVSSKYLNGNCQKSHNSFTRCFIDTVSEMCHIGSDGLYTFEPKMSVLQLVQAIDRRLIISDTVQRASLSVQSLDDITRIFKP